MSDSQNGARGARPVHTVERGRDTMGHSGKYVTLVSAEGFEYVVDYEAACVSNMIKNLMTSAGGFSELESNKIKFPKGHICAQ